MLNFIFLMLISVVGSIAANLASVNYTFAKTTQRNGISRLIPVTTPLSDNPNACGKAALMYQQQTNHIAQLIVGGKQASPHSWPWQVRLHIYRKNGEIILCGGSLIDPGFVLTAAHCVEGDVMRVVAFTGDHDSRVVEDGQQTFISSVFKLHEKYTGRSTYWRNDIALVKLPTPAVLNNTTRLICLPTADVLPGTRCAITGWGGLAFQGQLQNLLQEGYIAIANFDSCDSIYRGLSKELHTCAGSGLDQTSTCQGDSGGPLACLRNGKWEVQGITSFGIACTKAVFSKVVAHQDWIHRTMVAM